MNHLRLILGLLLLPASAPAALVQFSETSVNDADGTTIGTVSSVRWLEMTLAYTTATAPASWSSYRFTHWTNDGYPETVYRDAWGRAMNPCNFVLIVASTATAHYLPATRDSDGDGVPDWYEVEHFGNLDRTAAADSDGDGISLLAEYTGGTHPLYGNSALAGGVTWADSALVTCNLAGYATYTLRSVPAGTVNQSAVVPPGTVVTTTDFSGNATFGYWTLDGERQQDAWGVALTKLTFTVTTTDREAVAYLFSGDSDSDGVSDAFEQRYYGTLANNAASDTDGDGVALLAEYSGGTHPLYGNSSLAGGVAWADSPLVTCNLAGYVTYTLRSVPAGTVNQSAVVPPGTVITTTDFSGSATFGYWTLDGERQLDAWGVALTKLIFTVTTTDREAVAYLFSGDSDSDGVPDAFEQRYYGTLANNAASDTDGDGVALLAEYSGGTHPLYGNSALAGGVAWADSALLVANLQPEIAVEQPSGTDLADGGIHDFGAVLVAGSASLTFTIRNHGGTDLTGLVITKDGANASEFAVTAGPTSPVVHHGSTTFTIRFSPVSLGAKTAAIQIANNDPDENPFDLNLTGEGLNNAPVISGLVAGIVTARNTATDALAFTVDDVETAVDALTVSGSSSNPTLVPNENIVFGGSGSARTVTVVPSANQTGTAAITITVSDGSLTASAALTVEVMAYPPLVTTGVAVDLTAMTATLNGTVNPGGFTTAAQFEYGLTDSYGAIAGVTLAPSNGSAAQSVSAALVGLQPWTTYHYRLTASSNQGVALGNGATFTSSGVVPTITTQPQSQTVTAGGAVIFAVVATGVPTPTYEWRKDGGVIPGATGITLTLGNVQPADAGNFTVVVNNVAGSVTSNAATLTVNVPPSITTQPLDQTVTVGTGVTFTVSASGTAPFAYQWKKDGADIPSATNENYTIASVQPADAGSYTVVVNNVAGSVTSNAATLSVNVPPSITTQPLDQTVTVGTGVTFTVSASGTAPLFYQWKKDGVDLSGATNDSYTIATVQTSDAGSYSVRVTNAAGSVTSSGAVLSVQPVLIAGHLVNLSIRTHAGAGSETLIVGFVTEGGSENASLLVRAAGPVLAAYGVVGAMEDPGLSVNNAVPSVIQSNDDWDEALAATFAQVGAFPWPVGSRDAAVALAPAPAPYTVHVTGSGAGIVLAEIYDVNTVFASAKPKLVNVSARAQVGTGANIMIAGFVIGGDTPQTVLIRAVGPTLAGYGVVGVLANPALAIFEGQAQIGSNDDWEAPLSATFAQVGAFPLNAASKDAAVLVTLAPGVYTAQVSGVGGTAGVALVEIYAVP